MPRGDFLGAAVRGGGVGGAGHLLRHPGVLRGTQRAGDGRHGLHGEGAAGEAAAVLPGPGEGLHRGAAQARPPPRRARRGLQAAAAVRATAQEEPRRAVQAALHGGRHLRRGHGPLRGGPAAHPGQRVRRLPPGRLRQLAAHAPEGRPGERDRHQEHARLLLDHQEPRGVRVHVHRLLPVRRGGAGGAGLPGAVRPAPPHHPLRHAQRRRHREVGPVAVRPAPQLLHVLQGRRRGAGGRVRRQAAHRHRPAVHRGAHPQGPHPRLGGQPQRAHRHPGGLRQGRHALHDLQGRELRGGDSRGRGHQRAHRGHVQALPAAPEARRGARVQRVHRLRGAHHLGGGAADGPPDGVRVPVRVVRLVPGRRHPHQLAAAQHHRLPLPAHPRLPHRHAPLHRPPGAHHGAGAEQDPVRPRPALLLHDAAVAVREHQRLHAAVAHAQRQGPEDLLHQQRGPRRQRGLPEEGRLRRPDLLPQGVPGHHQVLPPEDRSAEGGAPGLPRRLLHRHRLLHHRGGRLPLGGAGRLRRSCCRGWYSNPRPSRGRIDSEQPSMLTYHNS